MMLLPKGQVACQTDFWSLLYLGAHVNALTTTLFPHQHEVAEVPAWDADHARSARTRKFKGVPALRAALLPTVVLVK
ncbi:MAG TPA: hypothetical protein VGC99_22220 [Candidatus Tectomicrobia bacterium]